VIATGIANVNGGQSLGLVIALVFVMAGIFKISVPFHQWTQIYEVLPPQSLPFICWFKTAGFASSNPSNDNSLSLITGVAVYLHRPRRIEYGVG